MVRTLAFFATLLVLMYLPAQPAHLEGNPPLYIEKTEQLTTWRYEMETWWNPFVSDDILWLFYSEQGLENMHILVYRNYVGEWSSPQLFSESGNFVAALEDETLTFFWSTSEEREEEIVKTLCTATYSGEWSSPSCAETPPHLRDEFVVKRPNGEIWLLWGRMGFWEYQVFRGDHWSEKQTLATTEAYDQILKVCSIGEDLWIFYEAGTTDIYSKTTDIYCRVYREGEISDPQPLVTQGFPYLRDVVVHDGKVMVFVEIQEAGSEQEALVSTVYDGSWSPLEAVAASAEGFLSGGSAIKMGEKIFIFWNGTADSAAESPKVDIYYRVYDGGWSEIYNLTQTPDVWEASFTVTEYNGSLVIIWRDKDSQLVSASYARLGEGGTTQKPSQLQTVVPKMQPKEKTPNPLVRLGKYGTLLPVGGVLAALAAVLYVKRRTSSGEVKKQKKEKKGDKKKREEKEKKKKEGKRKKK